MIFDSQELQQLSRRRQGELGEIPFAVLLHSLAVNERSAVLEIRRKQLCKEIVVEDGSPVDCRSNLAHETLGRFMVSSGHIDEATCNTCFAEACSRQVPFGDILIEKRLVRAEELIKILQQNLARKLLDGFTWREGSFRIHSDFPDVFSPLKVNVAQLIIFGVTRFATQEQIDSSIGHLIGKALASNQQPFYQPDEIKLSRGQQALIDALDQNHHRIDELAAVTGLPYEELTRLLYALCLTGLVVPAEQVRQQVTRPLRRAAPPPSAAVTQVTRPALSDQDRDKLMQLVLNYRRKDAFELLTVKTDASVSEIQQQYLRLAEQVAPWRFESGLADKARDVFLAAAQAYAQLHDPEQREELVARRQCRSESDQRQAERDLFRITTTLLDPAVQFQQGKELMDKGEYQKAIVQLEYALDLDAQNGEYRAELAFCRFLAAPSTSMRGALDQLEETLRIAPGCGLAHYYQGEILRRSGRFDEAEEQLKRAIKPMAPDRRPIDALHALTADRKQRKRR
jgi:Flp pilus assembly protein TadD